MQLFVNNWSAALTAPATATAVQLFIAPAQAATLAALEVGDYYLLTVAAVDGDGRESGWEVVKVTGVVGGMLEVERQQEGTSAREWSAGAVLSARATAGSVARLRDRATHVGTQPASSIVDLAEVTQDMVGAMIVAGAGVSVTYDDTAGALKIAALGPTVIEDATTGRAFVEADVGAYVRSTATGPVVMTMPPQSLVAWEAGTEISLHRAAWSSLTLSGGAGVKLNAPYGGTLRLARGMSAQLKRVATDVWDVIGQTSAATAGSRWAVRASAANNSWNSVCWSPALGLFVAVSTDGAFRAMTSPDGINWTSQNVGTDTYQSVCWSPALALFVAVASAGAGSRVRISPDGINWSAGGDPTGNAHRSVCWSPALALFVAVASSGAGNRVITSPDGINWTIRVSPADNAWQSVCWSPEASLFVAVADSGAGNRVMTSPDGITWTIRVSPADNGWYSVCWSPEVALFVAVAYSGAGNRVMTSPDGISWTIRGSAADTNWRSVCWSPEASLFVAVASSGTGNRLMTSA